MLLDIANCFAEEIVKSIIGEIGDDVFGLLVDEYVDVSFKEQIAVVFRFIDKSEIVRERFIILGQDYDGVNNTKGQFNGIKSLVLNEYASAYYFHCFARKLKLVVMAVVRNNYQCEYN
ncbi:hypothetical protein AALP_AAs67888U000200 [Arabis alpina]|uniref:DUF4371 domain-containing protein n=1 Tax=Arabis alpina TaxID=50452 RepID=A0A087G0N5_ARAAL|nr:hypothetical protein AALP_AAs67888U000200 [Arabis alpina]